MKRQKNGNTRKTLLTATFGAAAICGASAYEVPLSLLSSNMPSVDFHGFASQGFLASSKYNYLANNTRDGSFKFSEAGLNASINPFPRTRITAQGFLFDVGNVGEYHPFLDYASAEYTFCDQLGIRAGRIRRPSGVYNHIQDVDLARTFVLLPQGLYDARWRDWSGGLDGGDLFGNISLSKAGSIAYEFYGGVVSMGNNGGVARYAENTLPASPIGSFDGIDTTPIVGGQLWYNTPLDGLRVGASLAFFDGFAFDVSVAPPYGPGTIHSEGNVFFQQYSIEYTIKNWTLQAEYYTYSFTGNRFAPALGNANIGPTDDNPQAWYAAASYRFNKYFEAGAYYTMFTDFAVSKSTSDHHQNDLALCLRVDPVDWWILKVEGHYIQGTGLLRDDAHNPNRNGQGWFMLAIKTTFSF